MPFPSVVSGVGSSFFWPTQRNARLGPYEVTVGADTYTLAFAPDYVDTVPKVRVYYSGDRGQTWGEADRAGAPALPTTTTLRHLSVSQSGTTFYVYAPDATTGCDIHVFDATTLTWGTTLVGPNVTWGTHGNGQTVCWGFRRSDSSHVVVVQSAIVATFRQSALYYGTPGSWTGPLYLMSGGGTAAGVNSELSYAIMGASERLHLFWTEGGLQTRVFTASNTFGTTIPIGVNLPGLSVSASMFQSGIGCTYEDSGTKVALLWGWGSLDTVATEVARCDSLTSDTAGNWTVDSVAAAGGYILASNPGAVVSDGSRWLHLLRVNYPNLQLQYSEDAGSGSWSTFVNWRPSNTVEIYGISASFLTNPDRIAFLYLDTLTAANFRLYYDVIHVYQSKASKGAGGSPYVTEQDLGAGGLSDYVILKDSSVPAGVSSVIEVRMRDDEGVAWGEAVITLGTEEGTDSRDEGHTGQTARFIQITEIVTGGAVESGVAGY